MLSQLNIFPILKNSAYKTGLLLLKKPVKYISLFLIIVVIIAAIIIVPKLTSTQDKPGENTGNKRSQTVLADAYVLKNTILENNIKTVGTILANEEVEIRSEVSKKISGIHFKEGTYVGRGRTLFTLDNADLYARLRKLEIQEDLLEKKLARNEQLKEKGLLAEEDYDISETELEQVRADIDILLIDISKTSIRAPISGIVGLREVSRGSYVSPSVPLTTIQDVSKIKIDFSIPERYISAFKVGQKIKFKVDGMNDDFEGEVYAFEPKVEGSTRSLILRAVSSNAGRKLLPGTFANVTLNLDNITNAMMVPTEAVIPILKGHQVYIVRDSKAQPIDVEIGTRLSDRVQILSGLNPGDTVIITNILRLKPGADVKIEKTINLD